MHFLYGHVHIGFGIGLILGTDCSVAVSDGFWDILTMTDQWIPTARTSHQAVTNDNYMWIIGGETFQGTDYQFLTRFLEKC